MRPNTVHCVFTLESSICYGGHFYATSAIRASCVGVYHSFIAARIVTNTEHENGSWELLRRLVIHYHQVLLSPEYPGEYEIHSD